MNGVRVYVSTNDDLNVFDGEVLQLSDDEDIVLQIKQIDTRDIAKNYADYSYDFTVPGSPKNQRILRFWHDPTNDYQYSSSKKIPCRIYIDGAVFRVGFIKIIGSKENDFGEITSYTLKFNSNYIALKDAFGEKKINDLDYSEILPEGEEFYYYDDNIVDLLNVGTDDVIAMPLINVNKLMDDFDLWKYNNTAFNGIKAEDLRPALRLKYVMDAIEKESSIKLFGGFLDSDVYNNLFIWLNKNEYPTTTLQTIGMSGSTSGSTSPYLTYNIDTLNNGNCYGTIMREPAPSGDTTQKKFILKAGVTVDNNVIPYKLFLQRVIINEDGTVNEAATAAQADSGFVASHSDYVTGNQYIKYELVCDYRFIYGEVRHFRLCAEVRGNLTVLSSYLRLSFRINLFNAEVANVFNSTKDIVFLPTFNIGDSLPDMTLSDFFISLMKMFNLIVLPVHDLLLQQEYGTKNLYRLEFYNQYYAKGKVEDITKYVKRGVNAIPINTYKKLSFTVPESNYGTSKLYKSVQNPIRDYGTINYDYPNGNDGEYKIESKFNLLIWRYLPNVYEDDFELYENWLIADGLDDTFEKGVFNKPTIFLYNGHTEVPVGKELNYVHSDNSNPSLATKSSIYGYPVFSNLDNLDEFDYTTSLCFSEEFELQGSIRTKSLYENHYSPLINGIYSPYSREFETTTFLPKHIYSELEPSTQFIIGNLKYNISSVDLNLITGETKLKLNNVIEESNIVELDAQYIPFEIFDVNTNSYNDSVSVFKEINFKVSYPITVWSLKWKAEYTLTSQAYTNSRVSFRTTQSNGLSGLSWFDILESSGITAGNHTTTTNTLTPVGGYSHDYAVAYNSPISCSIRARAGSSLKITFYAFDIYDNEISTNNITVTG